MENFSLGTAANMAPSGIATFAKTNLCTDIRNLDADIAIIGAPCDIGIQGRSGTRLGPRGIRLQSTRFRFSDSGSYDPERDDYYLSTKRWRIVDCGDADYVPGNLKASFANIEEAVRLIRRQNAMPVILGGDHSISIPVARGLNESGDFHVIHIDAHLDWTSNIADQTLFNGSPCRQMAGMSYIGRMVHIGVHGIGSSKRSDFLDARANGDVIVSPRQIRRHGLDWLAKQLPVGKPYYVTIDIDGMDYSIAAGTGSPMMGGFLYDEIVDILEIIASKADILAFDMVEVSPPYDDASGTTCYLAARLIADFMGFITKRKENAK